MKSGDIKNSRGQIWIETVIYILVAFAIIGLVLAFVKPKIQEVQDKALIDQSLGVVKDIDAVISEVAQGGIGNKRKLELGVQKGILKIDGENDQIFFEIESKYAYSEPGEVVHYGSTEVFTKEMGNINRITLTNNYTYNITYKGSDQIKPINKASTPYTLFITNKGGDPLEIDLELD